METVKLTILLFFIGSKVFGQTFSYSETKNIFKSFIKDNRQVFLQPKIYGYDVTEIGKYLSVNSFQRTITYSETGKTISDTLFLTKPEKLYIDSCIQSLNSFTWTEDEKVKCGLERFKLITNHTQKKLPDFDHIVYSITKPIFIRQNSICFLFYDYSCGNLCGQGNLILLKKEEGNWVRWLTIFQSNS
ncbi:MAG: hypothetical protein EOO43_08965 [Flavobacterium sp.]|nr:MAG: hypothetical protein EOO43_08965 [Flavobacterium sp.]